MREDLISRQTSEHSAILTLHLSRVSGSVRIVGHDRRASLVVHKTEDGSVRDFLACWVVGRHCHLFSIRAQKSHSESDLCSLLQLIRCAFLSLYELLCCAAIRARRDEEQSGEGYEAPCTHSHAVRGPLGLFFACHTEQRYRRYLARMGASFCLPL